MQPVEIGLAVFNVEKQMVTLTLTKR